MSKRTERRAAERAARKTAFKQLRAQQAQSAALLPTSQTEPTTAAPSANPETDLLARAQAFFKTAPEPAPEIKPEPKPAPQPTGRAISAQNALKHGSCADTLFLPHENKSDYDHLSVMWFQSYQPTGRAEMHLIQELINADWFLQRATRNVNHVESQLMEQEPNPLHWTEQQQRTLTRFLRYQTTRAHAVNRARKAVEDFRKARAAERAVAQKQKFATERHELYLKKNRPEPTLDELIHTMREKAKAIGLVPPEFPKANL